MEEQGFETDKITVIDKRVPEPPAEIAPNTTSAVMLAMQKGYDPAFIEKMMELEERNYREQARRSFFEDFAAFHAVKPPVKKDKYNSFFKSWYTSLETLLATFQGPLGEHGLSLTFSSPKWDEDRSGFSLDGILSHRMGHVETRSIWLPIDRAAVGKSSGERSRNPIQDIKSTFTYARSMAAEAVLGVAGTEATRDDDGNSAGPAALITDEQVKEIEAKMTELNVLDKPFYAYLRIEKLSDLDENGYQKALAFLSKKAKDQARRQ